MIPKRIEMPVQVEEILGKLREHGYEAFAVGGCVRDAILGRIPGDWDITTSAHPEEVKQVFGHTIDTGLQHGTVTVMRDHIGYEITTYRIDGEYEDGRHPKEVVFTAELREDLRRRDFTINAMAYSHETGIVDIFGGAEDLAARRIRCVGDAGERFTEDALRILRAVRFSAQLGFSIEKKTWQALCELAPSLVHVSKERVQVELTKTLLSDRPEFIWKTEAAGLAPYISKTFPEVFAAWKKQKSCAKQSLEEKICSKDVPAADKDAIKTETAAQQGHMFVKHECETDMAGEISAAAGHPQGLLAAHRVPGGWAGPLAAGHDPPGSLRSAAGPRHELAALPRPGAGSCVCPACSAGGGPPSSAQKEAPLAAPDAVAAGGAGPGRAGGGLVVHRR